jgi:hypothetical protein
VPTQRTAELAEYQIYIVSPVVASALLKIDVDLALLARKTKQAPLAGARRAVLEKTRTFPVRDAKLAPQALDLMDDEPRMSKETLAGRGQRDTTAIARQEVYPSFCCIPRMRAMLPWRPATTAADAPRSHLAADAAAACPQILTTPSVFTFYPMRRTAKTTHSCGCGLNSAD